MTMADSNYERVDVFFRGNFPSKAAAFAKKRRTFSFLLFCGYSSQRTMVYNIKWIIPKLKNPSKLWNFASTLTFAAVGIVSKLIIPDSIHRLKWGVGRLILESPVTPIVVPIYHVGMDQVLPNEPPYIIKLFKKVTIKYGEPIDFSKLLAELRASNADEVQARKAITDYIDAELLRLKKETEELHVKL
ncbi:hypothetical protein G9C98_002310 [Cotesia typhae]|uniref:Tafazzin family protein n=1 Tax=Cotesia typhae TaxID=2053667 RepID=A0A8J5R483_9HYME|nr:hypothetical protein G9C98_002310 [Cotesia typhae]